MEFAQKKDTPTEKEMLVIRYYFDSVFDDSNNSTQLELLSSKENIKEIGNISLSIPNKYISYSYVNGIFNFREISAEEFHKKYQSLPVIINKKMYDTSFCHVEEVAFELNDGLAIMGLLHLNVINNNDVPEGDTIILRFSCYQNKFRLSTHIDFDGVKELKVPMNKPVIQIMKIGGYDAFVFEETTPENFDKQWKDYMVHMDIPDNNEGFSVETIEYTDKNFLNNAVDNTLRSLYNITETVVRPDPEYSWFSLITITRK